MSLFLIFLSFPKIYCAILSSLRFLIKLFVFKFNTFAQSLSDLVHFYKALICLILTFYHFANNFCKKFLFLFNLWAITATLLRFRVAFVYDVAAHFLREYHLLRREDSCDRSHIESHPIKESFQVKFFVYLWLSFFKKMSLTFTWPAIINKAFKVTRWCDVLSFRKVSYNFFTQFFSLFKISFIFRSFPQNVFFHVNFRIKLA